jgi:hypothetical protein
VSNRSRRRRSSEEHQSNHDRIGLVVIRHVNKVGMEMNRTVK